MSRQGRQKLTQRVPLAQRNPQALALLIILPTVTAGLGIGAIVGVITKSIVWALATVIMVGAGFTFIGLFVAVFFGSSR
jgi:hypothetical protein